MTCISWEQISIAAGVAHALGYLHAKNIVHGRLCSRNVFLESKVQVSLLDYAAGRSNVIYSSPELIHSHADSCGPDAGAAPATSAAAASTCYRGWCKADDVFAFGTLLFELFSGRLPSCPSRCCLPSRTHTKHFFATFALSVCLPFEAVKQTLSNTSNCQIH